uniref:Uncharacterized protein n=1 Tax=Arundo donax TaxID=35708 RepID=A0A0A9C5E8_ARUDO
MTEPLNHEICPRKQKSVTLAWFKQ